MGRDKLTHDEVTEPGVRADFMIALTTARRTVARLADLAKAMPDKAECHEIRHEVNLIIMRLVNLEQIALRW